MDKIIMFDGECNFCDKSVQFIIRRDPKACYKFASLQSEAGRTLLKQFQVPVDMDSFVFIDGDQYYTQSSAALRVCKHLKGFWKLAYALLVVPKPIRDYLYGIIAKNRYKWFGKKDSCMLPSPEIRNRFIQ